MKSTSLLFCFVLLFGLSYSISAQETNEEKLNLPGDNLNLWAVMKLFQESETLEGFEKNLNAEDSKINNLDLNGDDQIDYIKVIDNVNGNDHTIVLQVAVNERENQDVAVFTVQKDSDKKVQIQLVGDEELYGKDYIIEPNYDDNYSQTATPNPGYSGNNQTIQKETVVVTKTTYVEVASWPVVTYMYMPSYVVWHSPWYWGYYPPYWNPWRPFYWDYYYGYHSHWNHHYYGHYRHSYNHRYPHYNDHYYSRIRSQSNTVHQRRQSGSYTGTYSRPDLRKQGSADYTKRYPDNNRPAVNPGTNPNRPSAKPGNNNNVNRPTSRPGTNTQGTKPTARPGTNTNDNRTSVKPGENRPTTRPEVRKSGNKADVIKPTTKPASKNPTVKPGTRPASKPAGARPAKGTNKSKTSSGTRPGR